MAIRRPRIDSDELDRSKSASSLMSVVNDFAALAAVFDRQLATIGDSNAEMRAHLSNAKAAAERGLQLSRELVRRIEGNS